MNVACVSLFILLCGVDFQGVDGLGELPGAPRVS
jgi:hypothetical protein